MNLTIIETGLVPAPIRAEFPDYPEMFRRMVAAQDASIVFSTVSIVKGEAIEDPGIPAAFKVLVKEMQSLGLAIEAVLESGEVVTFGKDEDKTRVPNTPTGLISIGRDI